MKQIFKHVKPYYPLMLLAVLLLLAQAVSDLSLPDYMSDIVNVGIQQYGVERAAPDAVSANALELVTAVMPDAERTEFLRGYEKFQGSSTRDVRISRGKLDSEYDGELYVMKRGADTGRLDTLFSKAAGALAGIIEAAAPESTEAEAGTDISRVYALIPKIQTLPGGGGNPAWEAAQEQIPAAIALTRMFYAELGADLLSVQRAYIMRTGLYMLGIALLGGGMAVIVGLISSRVGSGISRRLRNAFFQKVVSFTNNEMDKFSTASLITRCTNDVMQIHMVFSMGMRMAFYSPIMAAGGVIMALDKSASMSWIIALACALLIGLIAVMAVVAMPKFKIMQTLIDRLNLVAREGLTGLMVIRAFRTERHEEARFDGANLDLAGTNLFINRMMAFMMPAMMLLMNGMQILVIWIGAHQIEASALQVGDMMAFIQYLMQILMSFLMISMMFIMLPRAIVAMGRVNEVLSAEPLIRDPEVPGGFNEEKTGLVEFKNVRFRYDSAEQDALSDISFTARPGKTTAIIGSTGSGKSTIVNLIMRFFDVTAGQVLVNGADVREVRQTELRSSIGYVPQRGALISGTIASNIAYAGEGISREEIEAAAAVAQATDFISEKRDGFDSEIAQAGVNVSGGQRQRIAIARALAARPGIFIFDDSFSALDFKTDAALRRELNASLSGATVIVVAQRVSTIMGADEILVLDEGRIVGRGTHGELWKSCRQYYEIASSQMEKEELE